MHIAQYLVILLFTGLKLSKVEGRCFFNNSQQHCICLHLSEKTVRSLTRCLLATEFEFRGGNLEKYLGFLPFRLEPSVTDMLGTLMVTKVIFGELGIPEVLLASVLKFFSYTQVTTLEFESCTFLGNASWAHMAGQILPISSLHFHNVTSTSLVDRAEDFSSLSSWLESLQNLTVTQSQVAHVPCGIGKIFRTLNHLDLSENHFQDQSLGSSFCQGAFPELQVLKLRRNNLISYYTICEMLQQLTNLAHLDLSENNLAASSSSSCLWQSSLSIFNLSSTGIDHIVIPLPPNIEVLDVSFNNLHALDLPLHFLKELHLSNNKLHAVPPAKNYPALEVLILDGNLISHLSKEELWSLRHLRNVKAGQNPYNCSCSGAGEIQALANTESLLQGWPQDYVCKSPPHYQGTLVKDVPDSAVHFNKATVIVPVCAILILMCGWNNLICQT
ncbi:PREDICTED: toll-like receptor 2 [Gavialis gangeticus]|uniref:toll-like receptor 2 n=1 Tax=Gavialis gangeticus TaxID=94835 RepID=UPI00092F9C2A|nr:PREDICTED: toll-like receptor 2 [Gavialis gangeticus]XP_019362151.1 PREDICTED: toll-like receptor 2 [Gavialis gangeticus]XP_019362152.1 PREDICTED: toll-like receptor 2 [Gavialis gangeticus]